MRRFASRIFETLPQHSFGETEETTKILSCWPVVPQGSYPGTSQMLHAPAPKWNMPLYCGKAEQVCAVGVCGKQFWLCRFTRSIC